MAEVTPFRNLNCRVRVEKDGDVRRAVCAKCAYFGPVVAGGGEDVGRDYLNAVRFGCAERQRRENLQK